MMQLEKPKPKKVQTTYVQAVDADTGKSRHLTVYNATPEQVIRRFKAAALSQEESPKPASEPATA